MTTTKNIPIELLATYSVNPRIQTYLLKITGQWGDVIALSSCEESIAYDDGEGEVTYSAPAGYDTYAFETSADLGVDNSEAMFLMEASGAASPEQIDAGAMDYGKYSVYKVNRLDLTAGRHEVVDYGTIGIVKKVDGLKAIIELRSLQQKLKQNYQKPYSRTCIVPFGSGGNMACPPLWSCGFDAQSLWQSHSVDSVGSETDRIFTANSTPAVNGPNGALGFAPGLVKWTSGLNVGKTSEVESIEGAVITLRFGTPRTIQASDTFDIRPDCDKTWETCRDDYDNHLQFKGQPKLALSDETADAVPNYVGIWSVGSLPAPEAP